MHWLAVFGLDRYRSLELLAGFDRCIVRYTDEGVSLVRICREREVLGCNACDGLITLERDGY